METKSVGDKIREARIGGGKVCWGAQEEQQYYVLEIIATRWVRRIQ